MEWIKEEIGIEIMKNIYIYIYIYINAKSKMENGVRVKMSTKMFEHSLGIFKHPLLNI